MKRTAQCLVAIALCAAMATAQQSNGKSHNSNGKSNNGHSKHGSDVEDDRDQNDDDRDGKKEHGSTVFSTRDRDAISNYYRGSTANLPPGLAKRNGNLPPGLRKQLQRNGKLPPGLQKRLEPLSGDVERRLPALPGGYSRGIIGQDVVIVENRTQRIMDVIRDVIIRR